eukprot:2968221-Alexandrium_andersonii.AAC.1
MADAFSDTAVAERQQEQVQRQVASRRNDRGFDCFFAETKDKHDEEAAAAAERLPDKSPWQLKRHVARQVWSRRLSEAEKSEWILQSSCLTDALATCCDQG